MRTITPKNVMQVVQLGIIVNHNEEEIRTLVREEIRRLLFESSYLKEGINIDYANKLVSFDNSHQNNVDTNDLIHPYIILNDCKGKTILSIFERKDNEEKTDGNPLVYALKGRNGWSFVDANKDIYALLRRFVAVTVQLQRHFDTLILTPSTNELNNRVFSYLRRLLPFENSYNTLFKKLTAEEVMDNYFDEDEFENEISNYTDEDKKYARLELSRAFRMMAQKNDGFFSYHYIAPLNFRKCITNSMKIWYSGLNLEEATKAIDSKDVLVFDDTVSTGKTLSDSAETLCNVFSPNSITFLTLFSPKLSQGFANERSYLG